MPALVVIKRIKIWAGMEKGAASPTINSYLNGIGFRTPLPMVLTIGAAVQNYKPYIQPKGSA